MQIRYVTHYAVYVEGGKSQWWIGLEDRDLDGMYTWVDGTPVIFVDWARHQPTHVGYTRCVVMSQKASLLIFRVVCSIWVVV